jgi:hypothetical protein
MWLDQAPAPRRNDYVSFRERRLAGLQSKVYQLLAIELEQGIELEALAKIFETLNKTGVRLNSFDLLVAKLYPAEFNLREEWETARQVSPEIAKFDPDGLEVIKLLALLVRSRFGRHASRGVRQGDVLALEPKFIALHWDEALDLYSRALATLEQFGVTGPHLVPSWSMVLGIAGFLVSQRQENVRQWWLSRIANQTLAQAANTRIVAEFEAITHGQLDLAPLNVLDLWELLELPARPNGLLLRGIMGLAIAKGAIDPLSGEPLAHSKKATPVALFPDGTVGRLTQDTLFSEVIFVGDQPLRRWSSIDIRSSPAGVEGLFSQGINLTSLRRDPNYMMGLFS